MGVLESKINKSLAIASLNYSGVQDSPYEFYQSQNQDEKKMNAIFLQICKKEVEDFDNPKFKWEMGNLDKNWHQNRQSPLYNKQAGVKNTGKMMNRAQFCTSWEEHFQASLPKFEKSVFGKYSEEQKVPQIQLQRKQCLLFDLIAYQTLIKFIYSIDSIDNIDIDSSQYVKFQSQKFNKAYLNEEQKKHETIKTITKNKIDIFFLQESNLNFLQSLKQETNEFQVIHCFEKEAVVQNNSAILIRKSAFPDVKNYKHENKVFFEEYEKKLKSNALHDLNWNEDSTIQVVNNLILISTHLTSKKEGNEVQVKQLKKTIQKLKQAFPNYEILVAGDFNAKFQFPEMKSINVYPDFRIQPTTNKKRTSMQVQKNKANSLSSQAKDYIVTTLKISNAKVATTNQKIVIQGKQMPLLPNSEHPYDHYLIVCEILF